MNIDLGVLEVDENNQLTDYREKPSFEFQVSMGIYCFQPEVCDYVKPGEAVSMPELILRMKDAGESVHCYEEDCYWLDIGRPDDYAKACDMFAENRGMFLPLRQAA